MSYFNIHLQIIWSKLQSLLTNSRDAGTIKGQSPQGGGGGGEGQQIICMKFRPVV